MVILVPRLAADRNRVLCRPQGRRNCRKTTMNLIDLDFEVSDIIVHGIVQNMMIDTVELIAWISIKLLLKRG